MKFHLHDWGKWSPPFDAASDYRKLQYRYCKVCGKCEVAKVIQPWNQWFSAAVLKEKT